MNQAFLWDIVRPIGLFSNLILAAGSMAAATMQLTLAAKDRETAVSPWLIAITVTLATFMELLDTAIANVSSSMAML